MDKDMLYTVLILETSWFPNVIFTIQALVGMGAMAVMAPPLFEKIQVGTRTFWILVKSQT